VDESSKPLIARSILSRRALENQVAVISGGGRGVGREAARALAWLGARTVIAEIDSVSGHETSSLINNEIKARSSVFISTNVGDEESVNHMARQVIRLFGQADIILNNATVKPFGSIRDQTIRDWDASYRVNLRGPILLLRVFLPAMLQRGNGVIAFISSQRGRNLSAYKSLKTAQSELLHSVNEELGNEGLIAFMIHPEIVSITEKVTANRKIAIAASDADPLIQAVPDDRQPLSMEAAGTAIAAAIALAPRYRGLEIRASSVLNDIGIPFDPSTKGV